MRTRNTQGITPDFGGLSAPQRKVTQFLVDLGLRVESEVRFGPYSADIYLPELKTIVEVDGPYMHHSQKREAKRDKELRHLGVREIIHIKDVSLPALEELARKVGAP